MSCWDEIYYHIIPATNNQYIAYQKKKKKSIYWFFPFPRDTCNLFFAFCTFIN